MLQVGGVLTTSYGVKDNVGSAAWERGPWTLGVASRSHISLNDTAFFVLVSPAHNLQEAFIESALYHGTTLTPTLCSNTTHLHWSLSRNLGRVACA